MAEFQEVAERRLVTVAFLDMVDSTPIAEGMDPEEFRDLVLSFQDDCVAAVEEQGGYVADYRGDAILAYFGYPVAHEDDAVRAVRACLCAVDRVRRTGTDLQMRAGLHSGLVVVGEMGAGTRRKHDVVMGDVPNVAARIQSSAEPGSVVVSEATIELSAQHFVTEDLGTPELKGITRSIRLFQIIGEVTAPRSYLDETPVIGREAELEVLADRFGQAAGGTGNIVVVGGEPGVGKSRLIHAFREQLAAEDHGWIELVATASDRLSPLRQVIELLSTWADPDGSSDDEQLLRSLLGLPSRDLGLSSTAQRRRTMEALVRSFLSRSSERPLVLLIEDAHWLDPTTSELLVGLEAVMSSSRVLLVVTTRGDEPAWSGATARTFIGLRPLVHKLAEHLAKSLAAGRLGEGLIADVVARTDGIPLFVEEVTRALVEGAASSIPTTLQQSLAARLDRLGDARELAQVAAVVGRDFDGGLLATVMEREPTSLAPDLATLVGSGLVEQAKTRDVVVYRFRHALVRDVAYETLLRARRRELHGKVAKAFESSLPDLVRSQPEVVAHHYSEAGETRSAIGFWTRAAQNASDRHGLTEAVEHATRALESVRELEPSEARDQWEMGLILLVMRAIVQSAGPADPRMEQIFRRACELTESKGDESFEHFSSRSGLCAFFIGQARFPEALEIAREMHAVATRTGSRGYRIFSSEWMGIIQFYRAEFEESLVHLADAWQSYIPERDLPSAELYGFDVGSAALFHTAYVNWYLGKPDKAARVMEQARVHAAGLPFGFPLCHSLVASGTLSALEGNAESAASFSGEATAMAVENEWEVMWGQAAFSKGRALWLSGNPADAIPVISEALEVLLRSGGFGGATMGLTWLAEAQVDAGDLVAAETTITRALEMVERTEERFFEVEVHRVRSRILGAMGSRERAAAELRAARSIALAQGNVGLEQGLPSN